MTDNGPNPYPDELKALNAAIAKAQGELPPLVKDRTAKAGSYSYNYIDLASVIRICGPVLAKHGLAVVQRLENPSGGGPAIRTELRHADGGVISASFPLGEWKTMQELGSASSYVRRYSYMAIVGVAAAEEDDDGRHATDVASASETPVPGAGASPFQPPDNLTPPADEDLSSAQRKKIFALKTKLTNAGLFDDAQFKEGLMASYYVDSVSGLTKDQASDLISRLVDKEEEFDAEG